MSFVITPPLLSLDIQPAMDIKISDTVDKIVSSNLKAAKVLSKHGIDFCSDGRKSLKEACSDANISFNKVLRQIQDPEVYSLVLLTDPSAVAIDELTRFIEQHHHLYIYENITFIKTNVSRLLRIYGKKHPHLEEIHQAFAEMTAHLTVHMSHEEHIVFPYIRLMVKQGKKVRSRIYRSVESPIATLVADHVTENHCLKRLDDLTHHYSAPDETCSIFKVTYKALEEFEKDLHAHIRLENEILFPKALQMESQYSMMPYRQN